MVGKKIKIISIAAAVILIGFALRSDKKKDEGVLRASSASGIETRQTRHGNL